MQRAFRNKEILPYQKDSNRNRKNILTFKKPKCLRILPYTEDGIELELVKDTVSSKI